MHYLGLSKWIKCICPKVTQNTLLDQLFKNLRQIAWKLGARLHETRSELRPVWKYTSVWDTFIVSIHMSSDKVKLTLVQISNHSEFST